MTRGITLLLPGGRGSGSETSTSGGSTSFRRPPTREISRGRFSGTLGGKSLRTSTARHPR